MGVGVFVLGMHRSGTSAATRLVNLRGFRAPDASRPIEITGAIARRSRTCSRSGSGTFVRRCCTSREGGVGREVRGSRGAALAFVDSQLRRESFSRRDELPANRWARAWERARKSQYLA